MAGDAHILAVIDLGSNTTKLTVLSLPTYQLLHRSARYTRLGQGIHQGGGELRLDAIARTIEAIRELVDEAERFVPEHYELVASSAVRDAENRDALTTQVKNDLGLDIRVLSGLQEAGYIIEGAMTDPVLSDLGGTFTLIDIGGGSLEAIDSAGGEVKQITSWPLGAVRLTERFLLDPQGVIPFQEIDAVFEHSQNLIRESQFDFARASKPLVGTGGAFIVARAMLAARQQRDIKRSRPLLQVEDMGSLLTEICGCELTERSALPGMSPERADIMPAALATVLAVADLASATTFLHSYHNLPYGLARAWLEVNDPED